MKNSFYKFSVLSGVRSRDQGFVMPIVIGLGIAMVLVTATIMARSQVDRQNNEAQQTKAQSKGVVDAAVSRAVDTIANNRNLATSSSLCGTEDLKKNYTTTGSNVCWTFLNNANANPIQKYTTACKLNSSKNLYEWTDQRNNVIKLITSEQAIDASNPAKGTYKLNSYTYAVKWKDDPDVTGNGIPSPNPKLGTGAEQSTPGAIKESTYGTLDISVNLKNTSKKDAPDQKTRIQVDLPVTPASTSDTIPGLWITSGDLTVGASTAKGSNKSLVASQVWLGDCSVANTSDTAIEQITKYINGAQESAQLPTNEPTVELSRPLVKFTPLSMASNLNPLNSLTTPNQPQTLANITAVFTSAGGKTATDNQFVNISNRSTTAQKGNLVDITKPTGGSPVTVGSCVRSTQAQTLPRSSDASLAADIDGDEGTEEVIFHDYIVSSLKGTTTVPFNLTIVPGCRVRLFILNSIDRTSKIIHNCPANSKTCSPANVQIYGIGSSGKNFCFNDPSGTNNILDAFVFAPTYPIGITNSVVRGAIWASSWGKITGCATTTPTKTQLIQRPIKWTELPKNLRPDSGYRIESVLPPKIGGDSGKAISWKVCQTDTGEQCDGTQYNK